MSDIKVLVIGNGSSTKDYKFGNKIDDGFKALATGLQKFKDVATGGFKAFLIAAGLLALAKFSNNFTENYEKSLQ